MVISIHAAQEGCDYYAQNIITCFARFQSTQPKRAATKTLKGLIDQIDISIHAAQEGCDAIWLQPDYAMWYISIHAAQEGCDDTLNGICSRTAIISIHAAQEGCDNILRAVTLMLRNFNPRSPRGLRPLTRKHTHFLTIFQSTQPKRAATKL